MKARAHCILKAKAIQSGTETTCSFFSNMEIIIFISEGRENGKVKKIYSKEVVFDNCRPGINRSICQNGICGERLQSLRRRMADITNHINWERSPGRIGSFSQGSAENGGVGVDQKKISSIVQDFRENICEISDEKAEEVLELCRRKAKLTGKDSDYLEILFPDELKNYVFRRAVNATTILRQMEKRCSECAACV